MAAPPAVGGQARIAMDFVRSCLRRSVTLDHLQQFWGFLDEELVDLIADIVSITHTYVFYEKILGTGYLVLRIRC